MLKKNIQNNPWGETFSFHHQYKNLGRKLLAIHLERERGDQNREIQQGKDSGGFNKYLEDLWASPSFSKVRREKKKTKKKTRKTKEKL